MQRPLDSGCRDSFVRVFLALTTAAVALLVTGGSAQVASSDEDLARRLLESGRAFARQGNHAEALKDFRQVATTLGSTSWADDAWLEVAKHAIDVADDGPEAAKAVDAIIKSYPTSNSAPEAYVIAGRLAMGRSRQSADLEEALANFDRVNRLFPGSAAGPRALALTGDAMWYAGRFEAALANLARSEAEAPGNAAAAEASLTAAKALVSLGDPLTALEELQRARDRWPSTPAASAALGRITLLHRLYVRARGGPAYNWSDESAGPTKLEDVRSLAVTGRQSIYWLTNSRVGVVTPANATAPPSAAEPRGLGIDASGNLVVLDGGTLKAGGKSLPLALTRPNDKPEPLEQLDAVVPLSNGEWLVMDADQKAIQRFSRTGTYVAPFSPTRVTRLAINSVDEVAGIDRDRKNIVLLDATGRITGRIPAKAAGYDLPNLQDVAFDLFGHLYVLDRGAVAVFSPHPVSRGATTAAPAAAAAAVAADRGLTYRLLTFVVEPEKNPGAFRRAAAFAVDAAGALYIADERLQRVLVYR